MWHATKSSLMDQVGGFDRFLTETQVRHGNTAGFLGVIIKVCLCVHICIVTNDLDGVLVSTYSTVSSQTPELTVDSSFRSGNQRSAYFQRQIGNIIYDTDGEFLSLSVFSYTATICAGVVSLEPKSVTSGKDLNAVELCCLLMLQQHPGTEARQVAPGSLVLSRTVICLNSLRNSIDQSLCAERSVQTNFYNANFCSCCLSGSRWSLQWYHLQNP